MPSPEDILRQENRVLREELGTLKKLARMNATLGKENASISARHAQVLADVQVEVTALKIKGATVESRLMAAESAIAVVSAPLPEPKV